MPALNTAQGKLAAYAQYTVTGWFGMGSFPIMPTTSFTLGARFTPDKNK